jgi:predicted XRE-type DNA-binding protein
MGSSLKDLRAFPEDVQDTIGYDLYLAQTGSRHAQAKPLKGFGGAGVLEVVADHDGDTYRRLHGAVRGGRLCAARFPEEGEARHRDPETGLGAHRAAPEGSDRARERKSAMTDVVKGSGNVFADLGFPDADMHALKAKLVRRIGELIAEEGLTQVEAAARMGLSQPDVSKMLKGQFRPLSLERLLRCLAALGQSVRVEVDPAPRKRARRRSAPARNEA